MGVLQLRANQRVPRFQEHIVDQRRGMRNHVVQQICVKEGIADHTRLLDQQIWVVVVVSSAFVAESSSLGIDPDGTRHHTDTMRAVPLVSKAVAAFLNQRCGGGELCTDSLCHGDTVSGVPNRICYIRLFIVFL